MDLGVLDVRKHLTKRTAFGTLHDKTWSFELTIKRSYALLAFGPPSYIYGPDATNDNLKRNLLLLSSYIDHAVSTVVACNNYKTTPIRDYYIVHGWTPARRRLGLVNLFLADRQAGGVCCMITTLFEFK